VNIINLLDRVSKLNVVFKSLFGTASLWKILMLKAIEIQGARLLNVPWPHLAFPSHEPKCLRPHGILRIANKFDFIGEKRESSVRFVFRGVLEVFLVDRIPGDDRRKR
jgi:hypothetical protein